MGDGTATVALLFKAIVNAGMRYIASGDNAMQLWRHLECAIPLILNALGVPLAGLAHSVRHEMRLRSSWVMPSTYLGSTDASKFAMIVGGVSSVRILRLIPFDAQQTQENGFHIKPADSSASTTNSLGKEQISKQVI